MADGVEEVKNAAAKEEKGATADDSATVIAPTKVVIQYGTKVSTRVACVASLKVGDIVLNCISILRYVPLSL